MITTIEKNQILTILFTESKPSTFSSFQTIQSRDEGEVGALHFLGSKKDLQKFFEHERVPQHVFPVIIIECTNSYYIKLK